MQQRTDEHAPVPQIVEETVEVVLAPTERVQRRDRRQVLEEMVEVVRLAPLERVQQTREKIVDVPQFAEETVEMVRLVPHERVQWIDEQLVEVFSGKEEFLTGEHKLRMQRDEITKRLTHVWYRNQRSWARWRSRLGFDPCLLLNEQVVI